MLTQSFAVAAAGLAVANAFLLPPELSGEAAPPSVAGALPIGAALIHTEKEPLEKTYTVPCPGCPVPFKAGDGTIRLAEGIPSHLELDIQIGRYGDHDTLLINDFEVFPRADARHHILSAPHIADATPEQEDLATLEPASTLLGYTLSRRRVKTEPEGPAELVAIDLKINEVVDHYSEASGANVMQLVDGIPNVHILLVKDATGKLILGKVEMTSQVARKTPLDRLENCTNLLCKWRAVIEAQLAKMRPHHHGHGCHKGMLSNPYPDSEPESEPEPESESEPEYNELEEVDAGRDDEYADDEYVDDEYDDDFVDADLADADNVHTHKWSVLLTKFAHHILLPILIGIAAGVSVSIIGMIIGTILVGLWRVFVRGQPFFHQRRRRSHSRSGRSHKAAHKDDAAAFAEEKVALMEPEEARLTTYTDEENRPSN